jgi:hypothetical protein
LDAKDNDKAIQQQPDLHVSATGEDLWGEKRDGAENKTRPFAQKVMESVQVSERLRRQSYAKQYAELQQDVRRMSLTGLYEKYRGEYNSWRRAHNPKTRQSGVTFDYAAYGDFRTWLVHLGHRPSRDYTVDRINFSKGYMPGNLRWASKQEQAENRRSTRRIEWGGARYTRRQFAALLGVRYKRLCKQLERGWPLSRVVAAAGKTIDPVEDFQFPNQVLEQEYWKRRDGHFTLNRLDWLPCFYEEQAAKAKRIATRQKFKALAEDARRERQRRYAERESIEAAKQDELLELVAPSFPMFNPLPIATPQSCNDCEPVRFDQEQGQTSMRRMTLTMAKEREVIKAFNAFLRERVAEHLRSGIPIEEAARLASAEFFQKTQETSEVVASCSDV